VEAKIQEFILTFNGILYEALPFIILGVVIAGLLEELVPQQLVVKFIPRNRALAIAIGGLLGILFPMCECGIIPVMRRLLRKGVPLSVGVCYMLAGPIINIVVVLSTYTAFSGQEKETFGVVTVLGLDLRVYGLIMMGLRMFLGFLVAFGTSLIVDWQYRKHGNKLLSERSIADAGVGQADDTGPRTRKSFWRRLGNISETALHDFVDITVFLILGAVLASLTRILLPSRGDLEAMLNQQPVLAIGLMMLLAILLCICSEADAFVAASFVFVQPAAKLAFLVLGPMLDFKLYMMYTRVFRPRLIWTIITAVVIQVFLYSLLTHYLWLAYAPAPTAPVSGP
jgi:uncharacterized membrane protein YraQ (UPF0718 family)